MPSEHPWRALNGPRPSDFLFLICAALYAWLCFQGIVPMSGSGAIMDSDLMTYAQGMAGESRPELFAADPVLGHASAANSIHNLERDLASLLTVDGQWAVGLLKAGAIAIFVFYAAWYIFGRWLLGAPSLAALLAVTCGITIWAGWGTFWGITHSDPLPRVFFGALMPLPLFLAVTGCRRPAFRPIAMLAAGLLIWVHGVSALNCGAMLFVAFAFLPAPGSRFSGHLFNLCLCLGAFFIPVLIFLWPSLFQARRFTPDELAMFQEFMNLRWHSDFSGFGRRFLDFFCPTGPVFPLLAGGFTGWLVTMSKGSPRARDFCRMCPPFCLALLLVALFCWVETTFSSRFGRIPMGHELVRGMRFMIPLAWVCAACGIGCLAGAWLRRLALCAAIILAMTMSRDRQHMAAQYAVRQMTGIQLPLAAQAAREAAQAAAARTFLEKMRRTVPQGEAVYAPADAMQTRYIAQRPLAHSFKDGYVHFYNKDAEAARRWLHLEKLASLGPAGWISAWEESGAPWLLIESDRLKQGFLPPGHEALSENGYSLWRKP